MKVKLTCLNPEVISKMIKAKKDQKKKELMELFCETINAHESQIHAMESKDFDSYMYYIPENAELVESHSLKHTSEFLHAEIEDDSIVIKYPKTMTATKNFQEMIRQRFMNAKRIVGVAV